MKNIFQGIVLYRFEGVVCVGERCVFTTLLLSMDVMHTLLWGIYRVGPKSLLWCTRSGLYFLIVYPRGGDSPGFIHLIAV